MFLPCSKWFKWAFSERSSGEFSRGSSATPFSTGVAFEPSDRDRIGGQYRVPRVSFPVLSGAVEEQHEAFRFKRCEGSQNVKSGVESGEMKGRRHDS